MADSGYRTGATFDLRPALPSDVPALAKLSLAVFGPGDDRDEAIVLARAEHLMASADPCSRVAETPTGRLLGLAITRRIGPLVLLAWAAVDGAHQGRGIMRALLADFPSAAAGTQRVVISSPDPKAIRRYAALGLRMHPTVSAGGILRPGAVTAPPGAAEVSPAQARTTLDRLALEVRGAAYGRDVELLEGQGDRVHLAGEDAAVVRHGGIIRLAVARTPEAGALALRAALAAVPPGATVHLNTLRSGMDWAIGEAVAAGLAFSPEGPVFSDEPLSPLHLPQGSLC